MLPTDKIRSLSSSSKLLFGTSRKTRIISATALVLAVCAFGAAGVAPMAPDPADLPVRKITEELAIPNLSEQIASLQSDEQSFLREERVRPGDTLATLLTRENATVTLAHSRTKDLPEVVRRADIVIAAVGKPGMVRGSWIKPGAIVLDVGINRVEGEDGKTRLVGDVVFDEAREVAGAITPVPGGVGPMTIAVLLRNTIVSAYRREHLDLPKDAL